MFCFSNLLNSSRRGPCMMLYRSLNRRSCGDPGEILFRGFFAWRYCRWHFLEVLVWKLLWEAPGRFLCQDLVRSAPWRRSCDVSYRGSGLKILVTAFYRALVKGSCGDPCEMPSDLCIILRRPLWKALEEARVKSCRCPYMISYRSLRRSCGDPVWKILEMSLALRSWRCFALVLVWKFFWDAPRKLIFMPLLWDALFRPI